MAFALCVFLLLSLFCVGLGFKTFIELQRAKLFLCRRRAFYAAVSGVRIAKSILEKDKQETSLDHLGEAWATLVEEELSFSSPVAKAFLTVTIEDESARLNINNIIKPGINVAGEYRIYEELFEAFFKDRDIQEEHLKVNYIADYIDEDKDNRESDSEKEDMVKNSRLAVVEELLLVPNISIEDYRRLKDFITVFSSDEKININTVSEELLAFLLGGSYLENDVIGWMEEEGNYYSETACAEDDKQCAVIPEELKSILKTSSSVFRIISAAEVNEVKQKITCVVDRGSGKILYWYEG